MAIHMDTPTSDHTPGARTPRFPAQVDPSHFQAHQGLSSESTIYGGSLPWYEPALGLRERIRDDCLCGEWTELGCEAVPSQCRTAVGKEGAQLPSPT